MPIPLIFISENNLTEDDVAEKEDGNGNQGEGEDVKGGQDGEGDEEDRQ